MKHTITRYKANGHKAVQCEIPTDNIEAERKRLKEQYSTDKVLLTYETEEKYS